MATPRRPECQGFHAAIPMIPPDDRASTGRCDAVPACLHVPCFQVQLDASRPRQAHRQANACAHHVPDVIEALRTWAGEYDLTDGQLTILAIEPAAGGRQPEPRRQPGGPGQPELRDLPSRRCRSIRFSGASRTLVGRPTMERPVALRVWRPASYRHWPFRRPLGVSDEHVGEEGEAVTDGLGIDEAHRFLVAGLAEEAFAGPEHDWVDRSAAARQRGRARSACVRAGELAATTMSPASCCFSFETSLTASPLSSSECPARGPWRVEDTTYLGLLFSLSARALIRDGHRAAKNS